MQHEPSSDTILLKNMRIARSLSQNEVAEAIGTNANTVSRWERGIATPSPYYRRKLAEYFGVEPQELSSDFNSEKTITEETINTPKNDIEGTYSNPEPDDLQTSPSLSPTSGHIAEISPLEPEVPRGPLVVEQDQPISPNDPSRPSIKDKIPRRVYILIASLIIFMLVLGGIFTLPLLLSKSSTTLFPALCNGNFQSTNTPATNSIIPTPVTSTSLNGEPIGLSEGATIFDLNRKQQEVQDKLQAAQDWVNNPQDVVSSLTNAISIDQTDAEAQIYLENWQVLGSNHPHITFIVGVSFSSSSAERSLSESNGTSRDALQGAYTAQKECNDHNNQDNSQTQVVLMIANVGSTGDNGSATFVANQIANQTKKDPTIVGIMGWLFSADSVNVNHQLKIANSPLPMISPTSASDDLQGMYRFFRICSNNSNLAKLAADFLLHTKHKKRIAIIYAQGNTYTETLKKDFSGDIQNNTVGTFSFTGTDFATLQAAFNNVLAQNPDAIFFSSYEGDLFQLLANPSDLTLVHSRNLLIAAAPALDATSNYPKSFPDMSNVYFPSIGSPDEWDHVTPKPPFFQEYKTNFGTLTAPNGLPSIDSDDMSSYDALLTLLYASQQALSQHNNTITPFYLESELKQITVVHPIQGVTGRIAFDSNGDQPPDKMTFIEHIAGTSLKIDTEQGCLRVTDKCSA